jgi:hypothetical protein
LIFGQAVEELFAVVARQLNRFAKQIFFLRHWSARSVRACILPQQAHQTNICIWLLASNQKLQVFGQVALRESAKAISWSLFH